MNKLQKKVAAAIAAGSILLQLATPVLAQTTIEISGNGADSTNVADVGQLNVTTVVQTNTADISNNVDADADTGNNDANRNTGGDVSVDTGDASTTVGISNTLNSNEAEVDCCVGDTDVLISGNGSDSMNKVELENRNVKNLFQGNRARIKNYVNADADTGNNDANRNTGGDVDVQTGDADVQVAIVNEANSNSARIGGDGNGGSVSARILGNGEGSHNHIDLEIVSMTLVSQLNSLRLSNKVDADADTGNNDANRNTGGSVSIDTGDASTTVGIDNMANFNFADLDCGCLLDIFAKIAGNGSDSRNRIHAHINDVREIFQDNTWMCGGRPNSHHRKACNKVDADADTGGNDANRNTGDPDGDPSVETGNADTDVLIENAGNVNSVGADGPDFDFDFPGGFSFNLNLSFNLSDLLALLGLV